MNLLTTELKLTRKQREILELIYKYRFLNRIQIQKLLRHKDYKTINLWLRDLRRKDYLEWIYSTDFAEKTKPAIYYLSINGVRYIRSLDNYSDTHVRKRYRDDTRSQSYINRCIAIADCVIALENARNEIKASEQITYYYETEAEYLDESFYHFLSDSELIRPNLCFCGRVYDGSEDVTISSYLLEVFDENLPRYRIKKRLSNYIEYLDEGDWDSDTDGDPIPTILLVCNRLSDLIYAKRRTRGLLKDVWEDYEDEDRPHIRFTTVDYLKASDVLDEEIWEEA